MARNQETIKQHIKALLQEIEGDSSSREGLEDTPKRVAKMYNEIFGGYDEDPKKHLATTFEAEYDSMVVIKDIQFYSHCEHHMVPFFGKVHIGYIPNGRVAGLSKFARLVNGYARRLQIQERLTSQIADAIMEALNPLGVIVVIEAQHMCMQMRGVKNQTSSTVTSKILGTYFDEPAAKEEFLSLIGGK